MTFTLILVCSSNSGISTSSNPLSRVLVVVAKVNDATVSDLPQPQTNINSKAVQNLAIWNSPFEVNRPFYRAQIEQCVRRSASRRTVPSVRLLSNVRSEKSKPGGPPGRLEINCAWPK